MDNKKFVEAGAQKIFAAIDVTGFSFGEGSNEAFNALKKVMDSLGVSNEPIKIIGGAVNKESGTPVIEITLIAMISDHSINTAMLLEASRFVIRKALKNTTISNFLNKDTLEHPENNIEQDKKECSK